MIERPIIFSAPMVRAILTGRKTQTRRIIKPAPETHHQISPLDCPYGVPGDQLWVRETFALIDNSAFTGKDEDWYHEYRADTDGKSFPGDWPEEERENPERPKWRPAIHMPRVASRINLQITGTRPERLQDISATDATAEGIGEEGKIPDPFPIMAFRDLWASIHGMDSWDANPLVWVIEFKRVKP